MIRFLHRHFVLPAFETGFKRRKTLRYWRELERSQWLARAAIEERRFESLRMLVAHAYENCPYYRGAWDRLGVHPPSLSAPGPNAPWAGVAPGKIRQDPGAPRAR